MSADFFFLCTILSLYYAALRLKTITFVEK